MHKNLKYNIFANKLKSADMQIAKNFVGLMKDFSPKTEVNYPLIRKKKKKS